MVDEYQVNDVLVYRDSAGFYRERPVTAPANTGAPAASAPAITSTYSMPPAVDGTNAMLVATGSRSLSTASPDDGNPLALPAHRIEHGHSTRAPHPVSGIRRCR